jgi:uncharacterized phage protein (TIGR01671 family)
MKQEIKRQIKYRVWDVVDKKFLQSVGHFYKLCIETENDKFIIQQFTGLKDKNDKDIYEGDLINFTLKGFTHEVYPEDIEKAEVWFNDEDAMFVFGRYRTNDLLDYYFSMADRIDRKSIEIVGNIYEK